MASMPERDAMPEHVFWTFIAFGIIVGLGTLIAFGKVIWRVIKVRRGGAKDSSRR